MRSKCVYFDLDGTLVSNCTNLTNRTLMAIHYLKNKGVKVGIATGRSLFSTINLANAIGVNMPIICVNGAWVIHPDDFTTINSKFIDSKTQYEIIKKLKINKIDFIVYSLRGIYTSNKNLNFFQKLLKTQEEIRKNEHGNFSLIYEIKEVNDIKFFLKENIFNIIVPFNNVVEKIELEKILKNFPNINFVFSNYSCIVDIFSSDADKGSAIKSVIDSLKINKWDVTVFGDNENDISMFKMFPFSSIALKNAEITVKEQARYITDFNCENEGVADFIFKNF